MKHDRFIPGYNPLNKGVMLIISDYKFWVDNQDVLEESIRSFDGRARQEGMILTFDHEQDRTLFLLKWAG